MRVSFSDLLVIATAYAGAKPDAVVIELHHAVVADVAVGAASGSEDVAGLAELELEEQGRMRQVDLHVVDAGFATHRSVLLGHVPFYCVPTPRWHDSWLSTRRVNHEKVRCQEQVQQGTQRDLPLHRPFPVKLNQRVTKSDGHLAVRKKRHLPRRRRM